jgi:hypothetical protein
MTGVVVTTVILMAVIVSAADYGLGLVVKQLYTTASSTSPSSNPGSHVSAQPTVAPHTVAPTSAGGTTAPVSP